MKTKLYKILGVALTVVLLASLTIGLATVPASGATTSNLKFTKLSLPQIGANGDYWATPGTDLGPIAMDPAGDVLFASIAATGFAGPMDVYKSIDGGYGWVVTGFNAAWTAAPDATPIVDIVTSPEYSDDTTVCVATENYVYISDDGGKNFVLLDRPGTMSGDITDLDVTIADDGDLAILVTTDAGEVWVKKGLLGWQDQLFGGTNAIAGNFLPSFADDGNIGICAIDTAPGAPGTTTLKFTFNDINDGGGWGSSGIVNAPFTNADGIDFESDYARIAFPDDFDAFGVGNNVLFVGISTALGLASNSLPSTDGSDAYKVILKEAGTSTAVDLDVRGVVTTLLPTATAITSIDVCGNADEASILVGTNVCNLADTPTYWFVYKSEDSGDSWQFSFKQPTGGTETATAGDLAGLTFVNAMTQVMMAPDFCGGSTAYASTMDSSGFGTSAFQMTDDGAASWNQISLIDDFWFAPNEYWVAYYGFSATGYLADDTLRMITTQESQALTGPTSTTYASLYERMGPKHWVRIFSYATPGTTRTLNQIAEAQDGSAFFAVDMTNGEMWRTTDDGATFPKKITTKGGLQWVTAVSSTTLYTGNNATLANNSGIWWTTKSGTGWHKPDDTEMANDDIVATVGVMGDIVIASTYAGEAYISSDGGETVEKVGKNTPGVPTTDWVTPEPIPSLVSADLGFADNGILYLVSLSPFAQGHGIWRTSVDLEDPGACTWVQIDVNQDIGGSTPYPTNNLICTSPALTLPPSDILYVSDGDASDTVTGGLLRSTNPTASLDSVHPPYFERTTKALDNNSELTLLGLDLDGANHLAPTFFFQDANFTNYWQQVWLFTDTLNIGVTPASPDNNATGVGLLPEGYVYPEVHILWQEMSGATSYQYQVAVDPDFKTIVASGFTESLGAPPLQLDPNMTYYWRIRVANSGSILGAPLISPWSETWKFKTAIGASEARPVLQAPWPGEPDVPLSPTFEWSGIEWAEVYEYELASDPTTTTGGYFSTPLVSLVGANALVSTAWKADVTLDYNTRYYWHVKAIGVDTDTPWSDVGTFTTMGVPPETPSPQPPVVIPPAEQITPAWIWAVVIIGAILVIAVIVLIVTTRRVP
jgi:hypothetical protein